MTLADHIRPLLRDHDCVIIPDFGGLVADAAPARLQPGRQVFSPPTKLVAFNQALTRNDGLLVDALAQHLGVSIAQARENVRQAVAELHADLHDTNRTELPGIGIFRRAAGRGLSFEYTGTDNLLPASYGLPEVLARPVQVTNARLAREKQARPALRTSSTRGLRLARVLPGAAVAVLVGLLLSANYLLAVRAGYLPRQWQATLPAWALGRPAAPAPAGTTGEVQSASQLPQGWSDEGQAAAASIPAELPAVPAEEMAAVTVPIPEATTFSVDADAAPAKAETVAVPTNSSVKAEPGKALEKKAVISVTTATKASKPAVAAAPQAVAGTTTIKSRTGRFYVIAGAFSSLAGAEKVRKAHKGGAARVILPPRGSRLYRLSVADFADKASAEKEARRLRTKAHSTNSHLVLNY